MNFYIEKLKDIFYWQPTNGIPNIFNWFKTIWKDRSWTIYSTLIKKLELQAKHFRKYGYTQYAEQKATQIEYALTLLKKIELDDYHCEFLSKHEQKWGGMHLEEEPYEGIDNLYVSVLVYDKELSEAEKSTERDEFFEGVKLCEAQRQEDIEEVFSYIANYIDDWND